MLLNLCCDTPTVRCVCCPDLDVRNVTQHSDELRARESWCPAVTRVLVEAETVVLVDGTRDWVTLVEDRGADLEAVALDDDVRYGSSSALFSDTQGKGQVFVVAELLLAKVTAWNQE